VQNPNRCRFTGRELEEILTPADLFDDRGATLTCSVDAKRNQATVLPLPLSTRRTFLPSEIARPDVRAGSGNLHRTISGVSA